MILGVGGFFSFLFFVCLIWDSKRTLEKVPVSSEVGTVIL